MNLIVYLFFWYAIVFGVLLIRVVWKRRRSGEYSYPHEVVIVLKEGQTIIGVDDRRYAIGFYIGNDVMDEKNYE